MCNLYTQVIKATDIERFFSSLNPAPTLSSSHSNFEPGYVGADQDGPIIRRMEDAGKLEITSLRWGFPKVSNKHKSYITNIRNLDSSWWKDVNRDYMTNPVFRCLVPFDKFSEWDTQNKKNAWFKTKTEVSFFAGVWRPWSGERLKNVGEKRRRRVHESWELFSFLTTKPNSVVRPIHPKAMPVILTTPEDCADWINGIDPKTIQKPLNNDMLKLTEGA